jgi:hypothetical protein
MKSIIFNGWAFKNSVWEIFLDRLNISNYSFYNPNDESSLDADIYFSWSLGFLDLLEKRPMLNPKALNIIFAPTFSFIQRDAYEIGSNIEELNIMLKNIETNPKAVLSVFLKKASSHFNSSSMDLNMEKLKDGLNRLKHYNFLHKKFGETKRSMLFSAVDDKIVTLKQSEKVADAFHSKLYTFPTANHSFFLEEKYFNDIQKKINTAL